MVAVASGRSESRDAAAGLGVEASENSKRGYGYKRVHLEPESMGVRVSAKRVMRLTARHGLAPLFKSAKRYGSYKGEPAKAPKNLADRDFHAERSMSAKGCSPDNAAAEGFFGRLKQEFFHKRSFAGVASRIPFGSAGKHCGLFQRPKVLRVPLALPCTKYVANPLRQVCLAWLHRGFSCDFPAAAPRCIVPCRTQVFAASLIEPAFVTPPLPYYTTCRFARKIGYPQTDFRIKGTHMADSTLFGIGI